MGIGRGGGVRVFRETFLACYVEEFRGDDVGLRVYSVYNEQAHAHLDGLAVNVGAMVAGHDNRVARLEAIALADLGNTGERG